MFKVASTVEVFKQPSVFDGFEPARFIPVEIPKYDPSRILSG